jgi:hypothetical protein
LSAVEIAEPQEIVTAVAADVDVVLTAFSCDLMSVHGDEPPPETLTISWARFVTL